MRASLIATVATLALLTAGCGAAKEGPDQPSATNASAGTAPTASEKSGSTQDTVTAGSPAEPDAFPPTSDPLARDGDSPPDISPDVAPDVAFGYTYSFGLDAAQIAPVQQRHARLCEELGEGRCEVKGMTFRRNGDNDVRAELKLLVEPNLAHRFGERALDSVREADGTLVDSQVTGTDVGTDIRASSRTIAELEEELADVEKRMMAAGNPSLAQSLRAEVNALRARISTLRGTRSASRERLATTPVTLTYASGAGVTGKPDFGGAIGSAWAQLKWLAYGLFVIALTLGPWALAAALIWFGVRARKRRRAADAAAG